MLTIGNENIYVESLTLFSILLMCLWILYAHYRLWARAHDPDEIEDTLNADKATGLRKKPTFPS